MMFRVVILIGLLILGVRKVSPKPNECDTAPNAWFNEGNLGEIAMFPWLGMLRVHLHEGRDFKVALTGLVLVKTKYAIANAADVTKIPRTIFRDDSKVMFILKDGEQWTCRPLDYMTHPEYEYSTYTTIALIELDLSDDIDYPLKPICWPTYLFNTSNQLYAVGYTDENKLLEKYVYKLQHVNRTMCEEFYNRADLVDTNYLPTQYQCAYAVNSKTNCIWDNGMALASNSTRKWTLIGFGIYGPGCAAPARFIDIFPYLPWTESATSLDEIDENSPSDTRRSAFSLGFRKKKPLKFIEDVPAHELLRTWKILPTNTPNDTNYPKPSASMFYDKYQFEMTDPDLYRIDRIDKDAINIIQIDEKYENQTGDCWAYKTLVYRESMKLVADGQSGSVSYKISLYDLFVFGYTCVKLKVDSTSRTKATLWYGTYMDMSDGGFAPETPDDLLKIYPIPHREPKTNTTKKWEMSEHLQPVFLTDDATTYDDIKNVNLLVTIYFKDSATLNLEVYGAPVYPVSPTPKTKPTTKPALRKGKTKERRTRHSTKKFNASENNVTHINNGIRFKANYVVLLFIIIVSVID